MGQLFAGIKVLDWTQAHHGAATGYVLADLGADVIKVEEPKGDLARNWRSIMGVPLDLAGGRNVLFEGANRNKRSITINLAAEEGIRVFHRLVSQADVLITNHRRSVREKLGLDYRTLSVDHPRLIYAVASGYGEAGPSGDERAFDNVAFARSGMMHCIGEADSPPLYMTPGAADQLGATMLALGVAAALFWREKNGEGQEVEASLLGSLVHLLAIPFNTFMMAGRLPQRPTRSKVFNPLVGWYQCADGEWIMFSINQPQAFWHEFCQALGLGSEVEVSPKFSSTRARAGNCEELITIIDHAIATKTRQEWLARCRGRGLICGPVNSIQDAVNDVQVTANRYVTTVEHQVLGRVKTVGFPIGFSRAQPEIRGMAPELGQHTEEVLLEAGYSWEEISRLKEQGAI